MKWVLYLAGRQEHNFQHQNVNIVIIYDGKVICDSV